MRSNMGKERKCILCHIIYNSKQEMDEHMRSMLHHRELENIKGRLNHHHESTLARLGPPLQERVSLSSLRPRDLPLPESQRAPTSTHPTTCCQHPPAMSSAPGLSQI
ncbi:hypothetical protein JZ751_003145 [Albula glossodonta]|uniref:C2H2-type domain-containing protein n=1 Tax=Albula glossodonta TaxID=121402 RepID=A0A8T2NK52_9TELE|nr:hypothetical protein JZ751_003145 [Albula glossodonta]